MEYLRKFWPNVFKIKPSDVMSFIFQLGIFLILAGLFGYLITIFAAVPVVGIVCAIVGWLLEAYTVTGIVLAVLRFIGKI